MTYLFPFLLLQRRFLVIIQLHYHFIVADILFSEAQSTPCLGTAMTAGEGVAATIESGLLGAHDMTIVRMIVLETVTEATTIAM